MREIELQKVLKNHEKWLNCEGGEEANLAGADLREANLRRANLWGADLREANLREANLRGADLRGADLREANLRRADLREANLRSANLAETNLVGADLREANLRRANLAETNLLGADLRGADIDYSCWPLWCGSLDVKVDKRIAAQLAYHFCRLICDDLEFIAARNTLVPFANQFHRVQECGKLEPLEVGK